MPITGDTPLNTTLSATNELSYNGVVFSVLYKSEIKGEVVPDDANRTPKYFKGSLSAEGICSRVGQISMESTFPDLARLLTQQGGQLTYTGRGYGNPVINAPGGGVLTDLAWGPIPKLLHFQPLGNGLSAHVRWECDFAIYRTQPGPQTHGRRGGINVPAGSNPLQFSYSCGISFNEKGYSKISLKGVIEVPLTRQTVGTRTIPVGVADSYRQTWLDVGFDLTKFRVVNRTFDESADRRKINWAYEVEELAPMNNPPGANVARGSFSVQPAHLGGQRRSLTLFGMTWSCNLKCTYFIRKDLPRRQAAWLFMQMLQFRMDASRNGIYPNLQNQREQQVVDRANEINAQLGLAPVQEFRGPPVNVAGVQVGPPAAQGNRPGQALLSDFRFHEGLYQDSESMTFEATWILFTTFPTLLNATGVWRWPQTQAANWAAITAGSTSGWKSWLANNFNTNADVIVDFGGGAPPFGQASPV